MQLRTVDGRLTLGSAFRLFFWGHLLGFSSFFVPITLLIVVSGALAGKMSINGEVIYGVDAVLAHTLRLVAVLPMIIVGQALMFGGLAALGLLIYRLFRPLNVRPE